MPRYAAKHRPPSQTVTEWLRARGIFWSAKSRRRYLAGKSITQVYGGIATSYTSRLAQIKMEDNLRKVARQAEADLFGIPVHTDKNLKRDTILRVGLDKSLDGSRSFDSEAKAKLDSLAPSLVMTAANKQRLAAMYDADYISRSSLHEALEAEPILKRIAGRE